MMSLKLWFYRPTEPTELTLNCRKSFAYNSSEGMACCAISAYIIYLVLQTHDRLRSTLAVSSPQVGKQLVESDEHVACIAPSDGPATAILQITGMSCSACSTAITQALEATPGILRANILLATAQARIAYDRRILETASLGTIIDRLGYAWREADEREPWAAAYRRRAQEQLLEMDATRRRLLRAACIGGIVLALAMVPHSRQRHIMDILQFSLCFYLVLILDRSRHEHAWRVARSLRVDMSSLSSIALLLSLGQSCVRAWFGAETTFHHISTLTAVLTGADLIKQTVSYRSWAPCTSLVDQMPTEVDIIQDDPIEGHAGNHVTRIPTNMLRIGDIVSLPVSALAPVDGTAKSSGYVVETFATGELLPRKKQPGDLIYAGSVVRNTSLCLQVQHIGQDTLLEQLLASVAGSESRKQGRTDTLERILRSYCSGVLLIALVVGVCRYTLLADTGADAFEKGVAILLSTCPCAIAMMVPSCVALLTSKSMEPMLSHSGLLFLRTCVLAGASPPLWREARGQSRFVCPGSAI